MTKEEGGCISTAVLKTLSIISNIAILIWQGQFSNSLNTKTPYTTRKIVYHYERAAIKPMMPPAAPRVALTPFNRPNFPNNSRTSLSSSAVDSRSVFGSGPLRSVN
jgi:hypothetical protein